MDYNEQERQRLVNQAAARQKFGASLSAKQDAERKALLERTVANAQAAEAERERVRAQAEIEANNVAIREAIRAAYVRANGGSEFGFTEAFPRLRAAWVEQQTLAGMGAIEPETTKAVAARALALRYGKNVT